VILTTSQLAPFRGAVAMVDGGFDPLHPGHVAYFREAARLGAPVLCNVAPDAWVARKHRPLLTQAERAVLIDAIRHVDLVHPASGATEDVLRALRPRFYVKGADWRDRLPAEQVEICAAQGTEIVFLDTVTASSTALLERFRA
jgi:D-beta-D-heptose 7-phosphate kinase/D-beta-D-heptose 1-phosphate adenosyltransferase